MQGQSQEDRWEVHAGHPDAEADPVAALLGRLAWLMDRAFTVPGTKVRIGLDAVLGLLPVGGDVATGLVQTLLVLVALGRYKVPPAVAGRMAANVLLDLGVGSIPLLGDLFDVAFKANTRNIKLLEPYLPGRLASRHIDTPPPRTPWVMIVAIGVGLVATLGLVLVGFITVARWVIGRMG